MMHNVWCSIEEVPYYFSRSSIKFQGHRGWKIDNLNPIWVRLLGRWQLSNPSDLPCLNHIHTWQASPQLSCGDICQIWMWYSKSDEYFNIWKIGYIDKMDWFSNPTPGLASRKLNPKKWCHFNWSKKSVCGVLIDWAWVRISEAKWWHRT